MGWNRLLPDAQLSNGKHRQSGVPAKTASTPKAKTAAAGYRQNRPGFTGPVVYRLAKPQITLAIRTGPVQGVFRRSVVTPFDRFLAAIFDFEAAVLLPTFRAPDLYLFSSDF